MLCDNHIDISKTGINCDITYTLKKGSWDAEDFLSDINGYGYASGREDGSTAEPEGNWDNHQDDCALWFNSYQNDYDNDGLTYWEEVNVYGTDPAAINNKQAIVVGINDYKNYPDLSYCVNDANAWKSYLEGKGYVIKYFFTDSQAHEQTIKHSIDSLRRVWGSGWSIAFIFSGHGFKYSEVGISGTGSVIMCYDGSTTSKTTGNLQDTELQTAFSGYTGKLFIFLDSCRSGGMDEVVTLDANKAKRYMTTTCTADGDGGDVSTFKNGAWTYFFLKWGLINGNSGYDYMEGNFPPSYNEYRGWHKNNVNEISYPWTNGDEPMAFDGDTTKLFYLWW